jgi:phosphatidate cytidylyltransferase
MREHDDADGSEGGWVERLGGDFVVRLLSGVVMAAAVALFTLSGPMPFALMVVAISLLVSWEWGRLVHGPDAGILVAVQLGAAAVAGLLATVQYPGLGLLALLIGAILATLLSLGRNSFLAALGVLYAGFPAIALIWLRSDPRDPWLALVSVVFLIVIVATADTAAFLCGRLLRGPLLWPQVSPKKTWSGLAGAVGASAVMGALFSLAVSGGSAPRLAAIGAALALVAQAGDLAESALGCGLHPAGARWRHGPRRRPDRRRVRWRIGRRGYRHAVARTRALARLVRGGWFPIWFPGRRTPRPRLPPTESGRRRTP